MIRVEIIEQDRDDVALVHLEGELTAVSVDQFRRELAVLLGKNIRYFVLNMEEVEFIDSSGLGAIIAITKRVRDLRGDVKLAAMQPIAHKLFRTIKADRHFPTHLSTDDALHALAHQIRRPEPARPEEPGEGKSHRFRNLRWF